jgi:hypothetical protein
VHVFSSRCACSLRSGSLASAWDGMPGRAGWRTNWRGMAGGHESLTESSYSVNRVQKRLLVCSAKNKTVCSITRVSRCVLAGGVVTLLLQRSPTSGIRADCRRRFDRGEVPPLEP